MWQIYVVCLGKETLNINTICGRRSFYAPNTLPQHNPFFYLTHYSQDTWQHIVS